MPLPALAGAAATGGGSGNYASEPLDRLVRKETSLGAIRELPVPLDHIGLRYVPWLEVQTDEVIFDYIKDGLQDGLAPARAEDAEAELSQKDDFAGGMGRASIIDWAVMDRYSASDVTRYRTDLRIMQQVQGISADLPLNSVANSVSDFKQRVARDDALRRRKLDNRIEWMIMSALWYNQIGYNDGKIKFGVAYNRPPEKTSVAPASGLWGTSNLEDADPIGDLLARNELFYNTYGVKYKRALVSEKILNGLYKIQRFRDAALFAAGVQGTNSGFDLNYIGGLTPQWAINLLSNATGIKFEVYDSVYRTRAIGSKTFVNVRFSPEDHILLLPEEADLGEIDSTQLGFGKMLTAPHPEGNFTPGFYEWEQARVNPWHQERGTGIKAFPVLPYMQYTETLKVL